MMPGDTCIHAFTDASAYRNYPAYLNVTKREADGHFIVTVRSRDTCAAGQITLTPEQWADFKKDVYDAA